MKTTLLAAALMFAGAAIAQAPAAVSEAAKPAAEAPKPLVKAAKARKATSKRHQDARHCLQRTSNDAIIRCAEEYL